MNLHWPRFHSPKPTPVVPASTRFVAATKRENKVAQHRRNMVELELAIGVSQLTPEQRSKAMRRAACGRGA